MSFVQRIRPGAVRRGIDEELAGLGTRKRSWIGSFERALSLAFALMVVNVTVVSTEWMSESVSVSGRTGQAAVVGAVVVLVVSAGFVLVQSVTPGIVYFAVCGVVGAQLVFAASIRDPSALPTAWWACQLMIPICTLISGGLPMRRAIPLLVLVLGVYAILRLYPVSGPGHGWRATISDLSVLVMFPAAIGLIVPAWRRTAAVADDAARIRLRSHALTEGARAADRQQRAAGRLLHDEVIHALRAISFPPGAMDATVVRQLTREACDLLSAGPSRSQSSVSGLAAELAALAAGSQVRIELLLSGHPTLPQPVLAAIVGAVGEAIRNVERHAKVDCASIQVNESLSGSGVEVLVVDKGCGFAEERSIGTTSFGLSNSIMNRIREVGGIATINSAPGDGTTVAIRWTHEPTTPGAPDRMADLAGTRTRLMVGATIPELVFTLTLSGLYWRFLSDPVAALLAVGASAATTVAVLWRSLGRPMPGWASLAVAGGAVTATLVGGWGLQSSHNIEGSYFASGVGAPGLMLIAFLRPPWESLTAAFATSAATALMIHRLDPGWPTFGRSLPSVTVNIVVVVAVVAARLIIDRMSRDILRAEAMERQSETVRAELALGGQIIAERLGRVQGWVLPFLNSVNRGDLNLADPASRLQATVLEAAVRDDIRLGTSLSELARTLIAQTRAAGKHVEINAEPEAAPLLPADLVSQLIVAALNDGGRPDRTVLTISRIPTGEATVSLLVAPAPTGNSLRSLGDRIGATIIGETTFLLLRITTSAATPLPNAASLAVRHPVGSMP